MATHDRTSKNKSEDTKPQTPAPKVSDDLSEDGSLQEALEETFPASDSIAPYIKPARSQR